MPVFFFLSSAFWVSMFPIHEPLSHRHRIPDASLIKVITHLFPPTDLKKCYSTLPIIGQQTLSKGRIICRSILKDFFTPIKWNWLISHSTPWLKTLPLSDNYILFSEIGVLWWLVEENPEAGRTWINPEWGDLITKYSRQNISTTKLLPWLEQNADALNTHSVKEIMAAVTNSAEATADLQKPENITLGREP